MELKYNLTGSERKSLVGAISTALGAPTKYLGAPTFAYEVGGYHIDKTGTLTMGKPKLTDTVMLGDVVVADLLSLAAALERGSEHPLAEAIVEGADAQGASRQEATGFEAVTGKGVRGKVKGRAVALGNAAMMQEMGLDTAHAEAQADACLLYTSPSPRDRTRSRMPSSA